MTVTDNRLICHEKSVRTMNPVRTLRLDSRSEPLRE